MLNAFFFLLSAVVLDVFSQTGTASGRDKPEVMTLKTAVEQGLRLNYAEQGRKFEREILKLKRQDNWEEFFLPKFSLGFTTAEHRVARVKSGNLDVQPRPESPAGTLSLNFGDYTLFNWGKDRLRYLNEKFTLMRRGQVLDERRRELRHNIIGSYFELVTTKERMKARQTQLRHASFVYRFNRERAALKKVSSQQYYQSRMAFLKAQDLYEKERVRNRVANDELVELLGDAPDTRYYFDEILIAKPMRMSLIDILQSVGSNNPDVLAAKLGYENAQRDFQIRRRQTLPLPRVTMDLGAYDYSFARSRSDGRFRTGPGSSHIDVVATVRATWSLSGEGGFFGRRATQEKRISQALAEKRLELANHSVEVRSKKLFFRVRSFEKDIEILESRVKNAERYFDAALDNYINDKTTFVDFVDALREKGDATVDLAEARWHHLMDKLELARLLGIEDFPGENFESLAQVAPSAQNSEAQESTPDEVSR